MIVTEHEPIATRRQGLARFEDDPHRLNRGNATAVWGSQNTIRVALYGQTVSATRSPQKWKVCAAVFPIRQIDQVS